MKTHATITVDQDVIDFHRQAGTNVSELCNEYLACCVKEIGERLLKAKKKDLKNFKKLLKNGQKQAENEQKTTLFYQKIHTILVTAKKKRGLGQDFRHLIDQAVEESGMSRAEVVAQMEKITL